MSRFATAAAFRDYVGKTSGLLPPQQRMVADYLIEHLDQVPFLALPELAGLTTVSEPTIVRFAQSIGFRGFRDLKIELLQLAPELAAPQGEDAGGAAAAKDVLQSVANLERDNILHTSQHVDREAFEAVVEALHEAEHTYVFGMGISATLAVMARYLFTEVGVRCSLLSTDFTSPNEQLFALRASDLLLTFSLPPYSRQTLDLLAGAREREVKTAVITDSLRSPASALARFSLCARTHNMVFTNSVTAIIMLLNALATQLAERYRSHTLKAFAHTTRAMSEVAEGASDE